MRLLVKVIRSIAILVKNYYIFLFWFNRVEIETKLKLVNIMVDFPTLIISIINSKFRDSKVLQQTLLDIVTICDEYFSLFLQTSIIFITKSKYHNFYVKISKFLVFVITKEPHKMLLRTHCIKEQIFLVRTATVTVV